jgi:hypothetical protein
MILNDLDQWDHAALSDVIAYRGAPKQVWDNTGIASPWLNLMRNSLNAQVWSFWHPDFLVVSATHGSAHLALFGPAIWEKYQLAKLTGGKFRSSTLIVEQKDAAADPKDYESPEGAFSPQDNSIPALQRRGVVFLACHNAIWELAERPIATEVNPDELSHDALAAELTNHLIAGAVLTPGMVASSMCRHTIGAKRLLSDAAYSRKLPQYSTANYFFGKLGQGCSGLMIRVMSCIMIHDPGMPAPEFNSTTIVIRPAGR